MVRAALAWVSTRAVAEEVVQETWLLMLRGLPRFEGRSSLRTWVFVILGNCARKRAEREGRSVPFASLAAAETGDGSAADSPDFFADDHPRWAGAWSTVVDGVSALPEDRLLAGEVRDLVQRAIDRLPAVQRSVMTLRDVEGWSAQETSEFLGLSEGNQRVLLHRARARVRDALRPYFHVEASV
jgi:RNA polymerase sigma-70 factor (ECF subfamily)